MSLVSINSTRNLFFRLLNKLESVNCQQSSPQIVALAKNLSFCCLRTSFFQVFKNTPTDNNHFRLFLCRANQLEHNDQTLKIVHQKSALCMSVPHIAVYFSLDFPDIGRAAIIVN